MNGLTEKDKARFPVERVDCLLPADWTNTKGDPGVCIIRKDTNEIIARHSSQYQMVKHDDILSAVEAALNANQVDYELRHIMMFGSKNSSMRARYTLNKTIDVNGDLLLPMIDVVNSYDGLQKFHAQFGIWRKVCSNGMFGFANQSVFNRVHVHENISVLGLFEKLDSWLNNTLPYLVRNMEHFRTQKPATMELFNKILKPKELETFLLDGYLTKYYGELGENKYAQLNAVTEFAKTRSTERRFYLESHIFSEVEKAYSPI